MFLEHIDRYWRVLGTGLSFIVFGTGGLLLRVVVFPAINLFFREPRMRTMAARNVIRLTFRSFIALMQGLGVLRYEVKGREKLERNGLLIVANHPTLIDTVFLMAFVKRADCIVKSGLWNNPFTHGPVRAAGYINNENGPGLVSECIATLVNGNNLIIFPEGTRSSRHGALSFKRGAANIAVRGMHNLTPVVIRCTPSTLGKGDKWWRVPAQRVQFSIEVREDIPVQPFISACDSETLAARRLTDFLQNYFAEDNKRHAIA
ncbi:lysophospholipid acyltransferase family protein [Noviherbaspirillum sedimenti]|uniref:1-acyl-sn-glycerol-3-phosphate acyltransferase n=1 Tax=Noviherbaspirillum sedimenti TaxID=2320865 RepID=A0A3A3GK99_9BURK|nr:lysophospholipid acyltransferase family protein [Noviherbaspirillum sedimenti]RJG02736.1 1-acyl-sn-glycerol-3-phosphate acyltransferase [Noviherbaspirillum sedimenti]